MSFISFVIISFHFNDEKKNKFDLDVKHEIVYYEDSINDISLMIVF